MWSPSQTVNRTSPLKRAGRFRPGRNQLWQYTFGQHQLCRSTFGQNQIWPKCWAAPFWAPILVSGTFGPSGVECLAEGVGPNVEKVGARMLLKRGAVLVEAKISGFFYTLTTLLLFFLQFLLSFVEMRWYHKNV